MRLILYLKKFFYWLFRLNKKGIRSNEKCFIRTDKPKPPKRDVEPNDSPCIVCNGIAKCDCQTKSLGLEHYKQLKDTEDIEELLKKRNNTEGDEALLEKILNNINNKRK